MRKLGIILTVMVAATLGYSGTASAQSAEDLRPLCEDVIGGVAGGTAGTPIENTTAGLQDDCNESLDEQKVNVNETLCGLQTDVTNTLDPALGDVVDQVHGGLHGAEEALEDGGFPDIVDADHPCEAEGGGNPTQADDDDDDGADVESAVKQNNAAADGGLPRTGGELFAGAGFGLMSLGALVRRFLP